MVHISSPICTFCISTVVSAYQYNDLETRPCQKYGDHLEDAAKPDSEWSEFEDSEYIFAEGTL